MARSLVVVASLEVAGRSYAPLIKLEEDVGLGSVRRWEPTVKGAVNGKRRS